MGNRNGGEGKIAIEADPTGSSLVRNRITTTTILSTGLVVVEDVLVTTKTNTIENRTTTSALRATQTNEVDSMITRVNPFFLYKVFNMGVPSKDPNTTMEVLLPTRLPTRTMKSSSRAIGQPIIIMEGMPTKPKVTSTDTHKTTCDSTVADRQTTTLTIRWTSKVESNSMNRRGVALVVETATSEIETKEVRRMRESAEMVETKISGSPNAGEWQTVVECEDEDNPMGQELARPRKIAS